MASRVDVFSALLLITIIYVSFCVYEKSFVKPDGVSVTLGKVDTGSMTENHMFSSLWHFKQQRGRAEFVWRYSKKSIFMLLLMLCGDIESCPGPLQVPLEEFMSGRGLKIFRQNVRGLFLNIVHVQELFDRCRGVDIMTV